MDVRIDVINDLKQRINDMVNNDYEDVINAATDYVKKLIASNNETFDGATTDKIIHDIPFLARSVKSDKLNEVINNVPLTRVEYDEMQRHLNNQLMRLSDKIFDNYYKAVDMVVEKFKEYLFKNSSIYKINDEEKRQIVFKNVFKLLGDVTSYMGYYNVEMDFKRYDETAECVIKALCM